MDIDDSPKNKLAMMAEHGHQLSRMKLRDNGSMTEFYDAVRIHQPELSDPKTLSKQRRAEPQPPPSTDGILVGQGGLSCYHLTHGLAAALMLTEPPKIVEGERLKLPVRTFVIRLPPGVVPVFGPDGQGWALSQSTIRRGNAPS